MRVWPMAWVPLISSSLKALGDIGRQADFLVELHAGAGPDDAQLGREAGERGADRRFLRHRHAQHAMGVAGKDGVADRLAERAKSVPAGPRSVSFTKPGVPPP